MNYKYGSLLGILHTHAHTQLERGRQIEIDRETETGGQRDR